MKSYNAKISSVHKLIIISLCLFFASGCYLPTEPHLRQLSALDVQVHNWDDDMQYAGLRQAAEQSIVYYDRLPPEVTFHYNEFIYSPEEMIASARLFLEVVENYEGPERTDQLKDKFLFFESVNSDRASFFTGYYEPVLDGSLVPTERFRTPLYEKPEDLIIVNLGAFNPDWKNERIVGRIDNSRLLPYYSREEITYQDSLKGVASPIAYTDEIELFFLQIQGSGLIRLPDGTLKRVNYAAQNGHPYRSIGRLLKDRIPEDRMSMQALKSYLYNNPYEVREILSHNQSYVFFREVEKGPLGYIDVPLTPYRSIAMDRRVIPGGGLAYIETRLPDFSDSEMSGSTPIARYAFVQDTGGAITGHGRVDIFLGHEEISELMAGHLKEKGRTFLIVARKEFLAKEF